MLEPLLRFRQRSDGRGRPPLDTRAVLNGVLSFSARGRGNCPRSIQPIRPVASDLSPAFSAIQWQQPRNRGVPAPVPGNALFSLSAARHGPPRLHENHAEVFVSDYSYRSATMGSIFAARRAGT